MLDVITDFWKPARKAAQEHSVDLDNLQLGSQIGFGFVPQSVLSGRRLTVSAINTYMFGSERLTSYMLSQENDDSVTLIVADAEGEKYLAISRRIPFVERMKMFDNADLDSVLEKPDTKRLSLRDAEPAWKQWVVAQYKKEIFGLKGKLIKGDYRSFTKVPEDQLEAQVFDYALLVSDNNEYAIEVEKYDDGRIEMFATIYRRLTDIGEVKNPAEPRTPANDTDSFPKLEAKATPTLVEPVAVVEVKEEPAKVELLTQEPVKIEPPKPAEPEKKIEAEKKPEPVKVEWPEKEPEKKEEPKADIAAAEVKTEAPKVEETKVEAKVEAPKAEEKPAEAAKPAISQAEKSTGNFVYLKPEKQPETPAKPVDITKETPMSNFNPSPYAPKYESANGAAKDMNEPPKTVATVQSNTPQPTKQEIKAVSATNGIAAENDVIECDLRVANKIIDEAIRSEMRMTDVVRRIIALPVAYPESVQIPVSLSDNDYQLLAIRYSMTANDRDAIKTKIIEELNDFSGKKN